MRVVRSEGLASCVLDEQAVRRSAPKRPADPKPSAPEEIGPEVQPETPAARPGLPDLPPVPEEGPEALPQDEAVTESPDEFDSFLQDAQDRFGQETTPPPTAEPAPELEPEPEAPDNAFGPTDLRPRAETPD